jgi:mRNA interferase MazF
VTDALRGQVYWADMGYGRKPWLVVSNNQRNRALNTVLAARMTTTNKHANLPTIVPTGPEDPLRGYVNCDDLVQLFDEDLTQPAGSLSPRTMAHVSAALRIALP